MEPSSVVELEIMWNWWIRRGCSKYYDHMARYQDPMDKDGFNESAAFPSVKPNFDIFSPPCRSRKQRGWYQVQRARQPSLSHLLAAPSGGGGPVFATAVDIPEELMKCILNELDKDNKHTLSRCGRVCRFWADHCRPKLFQLLRLRSRQDALDYCVFKDDPACGFFHYIEYLFIEVRDLWEAPWLQMTQLFLAHARYDHVRLYLIGPLKLPAGCRRLTSVHQGLPRSLPRSCSQGISYLDLTDVHFPRLESLLRMASELVDLRELHCTRVTWDALPAAVLRRRTSAKRWSERHRFRVDMRDCSLTAAQASVLLLTRIVNCEFILFSQSDLEALRALTGVLDTCLSSSMARKPMSNIFMEELRYEGPDFESGQAYGDLHLVLQFRSVLKVAIKAHPQSTAIHTPVFPIKVISIDLECDVGKDVVEHLDWANLDVITSKIPSIKRICLGFRNGPRPALLSLAEAIVQKMPLSSARDLFRYAVLDQSSAHWCPLRSDGQVGAPQRRGRLTDVWD